MYQIIQRITMDQVQMNVALPELLNETDIMDDSDNENDDDWQEMEEEQELTNCLFCSSTSSSVEIAIQHLSDRHNISMPVLKSKFQMDFYSYIKMINYIRTHKISDVNFLKLSSNAWHSDTYLKPVLHEPWLMYDFDSIPVDSKIKAEKTSETVSVDKYFLNEMEIAIMKLSQELKEKNSLLELAAQDIENMKKAFQNLIEKEEQGSEKTKYIGNGVACVGNLSLQDDEGYFSSYAHYGIHHDMLTDEVRTVSYRDAILKNSNTFKDKVVLDLGCGTSILSMFSSKAGASQVIGIDNSDIIYQAMDIVRKNKFNNINLVKGRIEDTELPIDKVDIIVSEWMGYFLLFEGMLDSVIYTRKRHLKPDGILVPNRCNISIVGYGDVNRYNEFIDYWKSVYEFDMSCMKKEVLKEATIEICKPEYILTEANIIQEFDLMTVDVNCPNFSYDFNLIVRKSGQLTSLVGYFDTFFDLPEHVEFSTSPNVKPTHWKQIVFYLKNIINVNQGDSIKGKFICQRNARDVRSLSITIKMFDTEYKYSLS